MKREGNKVVLEKLDLIRMNQLVRRRTDYGGFLDWFRSLNPDEQSALIGQLCYNAYQAGVDEATYESAARAAGMVEEADFISTMKAVRGSGGLNVHGLTDWLCQAPQADRIRAFRLFVYLFGEADRQLREKEDRMSCNHWWHRNLDDPRVVASILDDPDYYKTSPRDDP